MDNNKAIEILEDLQSYIEDNWDAEEYGDDIKENCMALDFAIRVIKESNVVGYMNINDEKYIISGT